MADIFEKFYYAALAVILVSYFATWINLGHNPFGWFYR